MSSLYITTLLVQLIRKYIVRNLDWTNHRLESRLLGGKKKINKLRYADDTTLMPESEEELQRLLKVKEESEKPGLKLTIQKTMIMSSDPTISWQIDG